MKNKSRTEYFSIFLLLGVFLWATSCLTESGQSETGFSDGESGFTVSQRTSISDILVSTVRNSTLINGFKSNAATYDIVDIPEDGRTNVIKIRRGDCDWDFINFSLANYRGKPVYIRFSADVMIVGQKADISWQLNNEPDYPHVAYSGSGTDAVSGVWYNMSGNQILIPTNRDPMIFLTTWGNDDPNSVCYIDNLSITIETWDYIPPASVLASAGEANSNGTRNIYVSASRGTDSGNGTQERPFLKIAHAMFYVKPGDTVLLDSGTYHERFRIPSGQAGKPVTLTAVPGADAIITPAVQIAPEWRQHSRNIYVADISRYVNDMDKEFPQLFADRDSMVEARFPNMGPSMSTIHDYKRDVAQRGTNKNTVVASKNIPADIVGARVVIWQGVDSNSWETASSLIQSVNGRTIRLATDITGYDPQHDSVDQYTANPGAPFYITGALALLDAPGEYYFDSKTNLLYFYPPWNGRPDARTLHLRGKSDIAIYAGNTSYVSIKNIKIFGGGVYMKNANNNVLENCRISYADHFYFNGRFAPFKEKMSKENIMIVTGSNNRIERCEFGPTAGNGIVLGGDDSIFTNNIVHDTCYLGFPYFAVEVNRSKRLEISHNSITNSAHSHIRFNESRGRDANDYHVDYENNIIRNNYFENNCTLSSDGGAFYAWGSDGGGTEIYNNFVVCGNKNDYGAFKKLRYGLYADNYTSNYSIHHNIVVGGATGLVMNLWSRGVRFYNNTVVGADTGIGMFGYPTDNADASTSSFTDNLFVGIRKDIDYWGTENGRQASYNVGNFVNGTIPAPVRQEARVQSSGNARGTVDNQYRPTGRTPDIGAIPRNGTLFPYGADWSIY